VSDLLRSAAGTDDFFEFGPVTRGVGGTPIDLTATGTMVWFTARRGHDGAVVVAKTYGVTVPDEAAGVTVNDPATLTKNMLTVAISGDDTAALERTTNLVYDVFLKEPSGRDSRIYAGEWQVEASVRGAVA
jgi:hypothetical protein